jgi:hypothetical protein
MRCGTVVSSVLLWTALVLLLPLLKALVFGVEFTSWL